MIDAHQHFWHPGRGDYGWMPKDNATLFRPYGPMDLAPQMKATGILQTVVVQAAPTLEETEYLLGLADATPSVAGVVGWIDFEDPSQLEHLKRLTGHPKFKGVRPMIQDIPDPDWMLRDDVQWAFRAAVDLDLTFDALGFPLHLGNFLKLFERYPNMRVVIDHCMKPEIAKGPEVGLTHWAEGMRRLAERTQAFCKLSGLITEDGEHWSAERLRPYVDHVLDAFGADRIMWGSDWPVCRLYGEYADWFEAARAMVSHLSEADQNRIFNGTARDFYRIV